MQCLAHYKIRIFGIYTWMGSSVSSRQILPNPDPNGICMLLITIIRIAWTKPQSSPPLCRMSYEHSIRFLQFLYRFSQCLRGSDEGDNRRLAVNQ
ncbi:hypothetical protein RB195_020260 [Necator americanus]|uniref:Uncharacterized protein n=1 Tax=Necator americanus TaxID=51031 RepID=A0ABR1CJD1_NECAM